MENPNFGSPQPILLESGTHILTDVYLIVPNNDGCTITSLKRNDTGDDNWATTLGFGSKDLSYRSVPIEVDFGKLWSAITITVGSVWVYKILSNRAK